MSTPADQRLTAGVYFLSNCVDMTTTTRMRPFRERLKEAAAYAGVEYSQTAIARALNTSKQTVDRWMNDGEPRPAMVFHIADTWNINARWLATDEGDMVNPPPPGGMLSPEEHVLVRKYRSSAPSFRNSLKTILKLACLVAVIAPFVAPQHAGATALHNENYSGEGRNTHWLLFLSEALWRFLNRHGLEQPA